MLTCSVERLEFVGRKKKTISNCYRAGRKSGVFRFFFLNIFHNLVFLSTVPPSSSSRHRRPPARYGDPRVCVRVCRRRTYTRRTYLKPCTYRVHLHVYNKLVTTDKLAV